MIFTHLKSHFLPLLIFILSFILRLAFMSKGAFHVDCLQLAIESQKTLETFQLHFLTGSGYPFTVILGASFIFLSHLFGVMDPIWAVNFMSVVTSSLAVLVFYYLTKKLLFPTAAIFAVILLSLSPIFLSVSVYGKNHAPSLLFLLLGILYFLSYRETFSKKKFFISALWIGLMGATRLQDMVLMFIPLSYLFLSGTKKQTSHAKTIWKDYFLFWLIVGTVVILFHLPYVWSQIHSSYQDQFSSVVSSDLLKNFRGLFSDSLTRSMDFFLINSTVLGLVACVCGTFLLIKHNRRLVIFCLLWFFIPLFFLGNLWSTTPRFLTILLPPLLITQSYVLAHLFSNRQLILKILSIFIPTVIIMVTFTYMYPILKSRHEKDIFVDYVQWISQTVEPEAYVVTTDGALFYRYYTRLNLIGRPCKAFDYNQEDLLKFKDNLDKLLAQGIPVYIPKSNLKSYDYKNQFSNFIQNHYNLECVGQHPYETWHPDFIRQIVYINPLYRILPKSTQAF